MVDVWFCVPHAKAEALVAAVGVAQGVSTCEAHKPPLARMRSLGPPAQCAHCLPNRRPAYFVSADAPLCIRHAADAEFPEDDMGAHDMQHAAYLRLGALGVDNAY